MSSIGLNVITMIESCTDSYCYTGSERLALARDIILASNLDTNDKLLEMMFALHGYINNLRKTYWKARDAEELFTIQRRERLAIELLGSIKGTSPKDNEVGEVNAPAPTKK